MTTLKSSSRVRAYNEDGVPAYDIEAFERDAESGFWFPAHVSEYNVDDPALKKSIAEWKENGGKQDVCPQSPSTKCLAHYRLHFLEACASDEQGILVPVFAIE